MYKLCIMYTFRCYGKDGYKKIQKKKLKINYGILVDALSRNSANIMYLISGPQKRFYKRLTRVTS